MIGVLEHRGDALGERVHGAHAQDLRQGPHGGVESNRWAKNFEGVAPETLSSGKFSKEESETVRQAVTEYCERRNITAGHLCSEQMDHKQECKGAWMEIARNLPHRTVQSVYRHGLRQMNTFKRGAWSEEEVQALLDYVNEHGKKWSGLQVRSLSRVHYFSDVMFRLYITLLYITCSERNLKNLLTLLSFFRFPTAHLLFFIHSFIYSWSPKKLINRSADSCRDKYREINTDYVKGRWKDDETETLKNLIREQLNASHDAEMTDLAKEVEEKQIVMPWSAISKKMVNRSRLSCFKKWQKMTGQGEPASKAGAAAGGKRKADGMPPVLGGDDLTPNPITGDEAEATAAQIAAETVEAVDLPVLNEDDGDHRPKRTRTTHTAQV